MPCIASQSLADLIGAGANIVVVISCPNHESVVPHDSCNHSRFSVHVGGLICSCEDKHAVQDIALSRQALTQIVF